MLDTRVQAIDTELLYATPRSKQLKMFKKFKKFKNVLDKPSEVYRMGTVVQQDSKTDL